MIAPSAAVAIPQPSERAGTRQWLGLALLVLPTLLLAADITVLYLALPLLSADLGPTGTETLWIIDLYGFVLASLLITMGTVGDRIGRRRLLMIGAVTFGLAALLAAYAMSPATLIVARAFMGVAGAIMLPSTVALIATMFQEPAQRTQAIGVWAASFSAGIALGPLVGGGLLESFWWGSVFLVNVLVMGMVVGMAPLVLPEDRSSVVGRIDVPSMTLSLAAVIATIYGIKELAHGGMAVRADVAIAAGLLAGVAFVRRQNRLTDPLLDVSLFRGRTFSGAVAVLLVGMATIGGIYLFVTQYLQFVEGLTPIAAGLWLLPSATALVVSSMLTPVVARRARPSHVVVAGLAIAAIGFLVLTRVPDAGLSPLISGFTLVYLGIAPLVVLGTDLVVGGAPAHKAGSAAAIAQTSTQLGVALGIALLGSVGNAIYRTQMNDRVPGSTPTEAAAAAHDSLAGAAVAAAEMPRELADQLRDAASEAFAHSLGTVAIIGAALVTGLAVLTSVILRHLRPPAPRNSQQTGSDGSSPDRPPPPPVAITAASGQQRFRGVAVRPRPPAQGFVGRRRRCL